MFCYGFLDMGTLVFRGFMSVLPNDFTKNLANIVVLKVSMIQFYVRMILGPCSCLITQ